MSRSNAVSVLRSDGGLITCLLEMAFAGNCGITVDVTEAGGLAGMSSDSGLAALEILFNEDLGLVLEVLPHNMAAVMRAFAKASVPCVPIGVVEGLRGDVTVIFRGECVVNSSVMELRDQWESTSFALEKRQCDALCVEQERRSLLERTGPTYRVTFNVPSFSPSLLHPSAVPYPSLSPSSKPRVAVIRQEGSNGDREMLAAFHMAGLEAWDVNMRDLTSGHITLDRFRGVAFCGGFSYADVTGSAKGWAGVIRYHPSVWDQFEAFRKRPNSFSLGVCNGCQLMTLLGWVPGEPLSPLQSARHHVPLLPHSERLQPRLVHNTSGRFESRWSTVRIMPSRAVLLRGMEDSVLGVWSAHGEGRVFFPGDAERTATSESTEGRGGDDSTGASPWAKTQLQEVKDKQLAPIRYVDDAFLPTEAYPMNPNGSPDGIAALCSDDGRHLAIMPHPERCFLQWQWPHSPLEWTRRPGDGSSVPLEHMASPWAMLFHNAHRFCSAIE